MRTAYLILFTFVSFAGFGSHAQQRESVIDGRTAPEFGIVYDIDSLPPLCRTMGYDGRHVGIGDCSLYCEVRGSGPAMVVINGGPGGTHHCFHPWFEAAENFATVVYYDQRGCGLSDHEEGEGYTFRQAVDDLDKLRRVLGFDSWVVCGYSYGGALAQYYAAAYPRHTDGMVLIGAAPLLGDSLPAGSRQRMFITEREREWLVRLGKMYNDLDINGLQFRVNRTLLGDWKRQHFYKPTLDEATLEALYEWEHDTRFRQKVGWGYKEYDFRGVFTDCPVPTLLCEGEWDLTWVEAKKDIFRRSHPRARYELFENAGHAVFSEQPETFFATLGDFINGLEPVPGARIEAWENEIEPILGPQEELFARENRFIRLIETAGIAEGRRFYTQFVAENPGVILFTESAMNNLGYLCWHKDDFSAAVDIFLLNLEQYPGSASILENLAFSYDYVPDREKALEYYRKVLDIEPEKEYLKERIDKLQKYGDDNK